MQTEISILIYQIEFQLNRFKSSAKNFSFAAFGQLNIMSVFYYKNEIRYIAIKLQCLMSNFTKDTYGEIAYKYVAG